MIRSHRVWPSIPVRQRGEWTANKQKIFSKYFEAKYCLSKLLDQDSWLRESLPGTEITWEGLRREGNSAAALSHWTMAAFILEQSFFETQLMPEARVDALVKLKSWAWTVPHSSLLQTSFTYTCYWGYEESCILIQMWRNTAVSLHTSFYALGRTENLLNYFSVKLGICWKLRDEDRAFFLIKPNPFYPSLFSSYITLWALSCHGALGVRCVLAGWEDGSLLWHPRSVWTSHHASCSGGTHRVTE